MPTKNKKKVIDKLSNELNIAKANANVIKKDSVMDKIIRLYNNDIIYQKLIEQNDVISRELQKRMAIQEKEDVQSSRAKTYRQKQIQLRRKPKTTRRSSPPQSYKRKKDKQDTQAKKKESSKINARKLARNELLSARRGLRTKKIKPNLTINTRKLRNLPVYIGDYNDNKKSDNIRANKYDYVKLNGDIDKKNIIGKTPEKGRTYKVKYNEDDSIMLLTDIINGNTFKIKTGMRDTKDNTIFAFTNVSDENIFARAPSEKEIKLAREEERKKKRETEKREKERLRKQYNDSPGKKRPPAKKDNVDDVINDMNKLFDTISIYSAQSKKISREVKSLLEKRSSLENIPKIKNLQSTIKKKKDKGNFKKFLEKLRKYSKKKKLPSPKQKSPTISPDEKKVPPNTPDYTWLDNVKNEKSPRSAKQMSPSSIGDNLTNEQESGTFYSTSPRPPPPPPCLPLPTAIFNPTP